MDIFKIILNLILPSRCAFCRRIINDGDVCQECWQKIYWISRQSSCDICGAPMRYKLHHLCDHCRIERPIFDKSISVYVYDDFAKLPILRLKHNDEISMAKTFAKWIYRIAKDEILSSDIIIPVPIHVKKLRKRMYNQSYLIAKELSKLSKISSNPLILQKPINTMAQEGLSQEMRLKNVIGSFAIEAKYAQAISGKNVILIDDVITTGSTAQECTKVLKQHGAKRVILLTVAKTLLKYN